MFLIGEESLLLAPDGDTGTDPDPTIAIEGIGGRSSRRTHRSLRLPAALQGARGPALLGLAVAASALAALRPWEGGAPDRPAHVSPRSPLISRSAAGAPARPTVRAHPPAARPADVHRRSVAHHQEHSRRTKAPAPSRQRVTQVEPEREPIQQVAPEPSSAVTPTTGAASVPTPASSADQAPPSPPPSSSGGGPGGVEDPPPAEREEAERGAPVVENFGFER